MPFAPFDNVIVPEYIVPDRVLVVVIVQTFPEHVTDTVGGGADTVTVAVADLVESALLVAVTVNVPAVEAANNPPGASLLHVTLVSVAFVTAAVNCCVWPMVSVLLVGVIVTATTGAVFTPVMLSDPIHPVQLGMAATQESNFTCIHHQVDVAGDGPPTIVPRAPFGSVP